MIEKIQIEVTPKEPRNTKARKDRLARTANRTALEEPPKKA